MLTRLRHYQLGLNHQVRAAWASGKRNVLAVSPTGGGKTVNMSALFEEHPGASIGVAHRMELVSQMSLAIARNGIRHRVIGPHVLIRNIVNLHMSECGRSFFDPLARCGVAGVDTLVRREATDPWFKQVTLWQTDEAHHLLKDNKWGEATQLFPNALGVGWTATPGRADGYGLGTATLGGDGIMDAMVFGPSMRDLIDQAYLVDYTIFCPPSDLDLSQVDVGDSGDFNQKKLREATHKSRIVGDVVASYLRFAPGKLGITFAVDVEEAVKIAAAYRAAGVPAEVVTSKTPDTLRLALMRRFRNREILQLVNVDLFGEGTDVPACEVVSMARATASFTLYAQQFGRALRLMIPADLMERWDDFTVEQRKAYIMTSGKTRAIIIDHVENYVRHNGPPDMPRRWSLARRERRAKVAGGDGTIPQRVCTGCTQPFARVKKICPYCFKVAVPTSRAGPEFVDGDLEELDPAVLATMRKEAVRIMGNFFAPNGTPSGLYKDMSDKWHTRQDAQRDLRASIALYAGWLKMQGMEDSEIYRRFYFRFKMDVMTAQALGSREAAELQADIDTALQAAGVVSV